MALSRGLPAALRHLSPRASRLQGAQLSTLSKQANHSAAVRCGTALLQARCVPGSIKPWSRGDASATPIAGLKADKPLIGEGDMDSFELNSKGNIVSVTWDDGEKSNFHALWLRYSCHSEESLEVSTGQRLYRVEELDPDVFIKSVDRDDENLIITYGGKENHKGSVPIKFLKHYDYSTNALARKKAAIDVDTYATTIPELTYDEVTKRDDGIYRWTKHLTDYGFCVIKGVPTDDELYVCKMAEMIGHVQDTIYDDTFDVHVSDHQAVNIAYSAVGLIYHQDLVYYESPPGLQFLHTLKFDDCVVGGESLIVDLFKVAADFRKTNPVEFEALCTVPATFQKIHYGRTIPVHQTYTRPLIKLNPEGQMVGVYWEPAHEGPIEVPEHQVEAYYKAHIAFAKAVKEAPVQFEWKMKPGDLLVFNNRRVCHARNSFVMNGGTRWLKGCYVNIDHFKSRFTCLSHKFGNGAPSKRVGNDCLF